MVGTDYKNFYTNYAYHYHIYKLRTLKAIFKDIPAFNEKYLTQEIVGFQESDYMRFLKSEIRMTCFHAIETLFELIFALEPTDGKCKDYIILHELSTSNFTKNYRRIERIAIDDSELDFLDIHVPAFEKDPLWTHLFFFAPPVNEPGVVDILNDSKKAIKEFLKEIAKTFSDRDEYNAYKHGIRALNTISNFGFSGADGSKPASFDLSDSMSYMTVEKENGKVKALLLKTKVFNTEKDIKMTQLCSVLITNIIARRKYMFIPEENDRPLETTNFPSGFVDDMIKTHPPVNGMSMETMTIRSEI